MAVKTPKVTTVDSNIVDEAVGPPRPLGIRREQEAAVRTSDLNYGIQRYPWQLSTNKDPRNILSFNVNPASVDFNFNGRGTISQTARGRVIDRIRGADTTGYFDLDVSFTMQSGNLLTPDQTISLGHKTLYRILEIMNEDVYTTDNKINFQHLLINTMTFGTLTLDGFLDIGSVSVNESAEDPYKREYSLTFNVIKISPSIITFNSLVEAFNQ